MTANDHRPTRPMAGRTVLVTGTTSGIGRVTAARLGALGATVLVHARTPDRAAAVATELATGQAADREPAGFVPVAADLGSLAGVARLAEQVAAVTPDGLHVLVNNAGAAFPRRALSPEGVERTIAVNHLAGAALTATLLELLRAGAAASGRASRVVTLSSTMERRGDPGLDDWSYPDGYRQFQAYADAKLISLAYGYRLARELDGTGVAVHAADPGSVATRFGHNAGGVFRWIQLLGRPFLAGPEQGARSSVTAATDPALDGSTGGYHDRTGPRTSSAASRDPGFGDRVHARTTALLAPLTR